MSLYFYVSVFRLVGVRTLFEALREVLLCLYFGTPSFFLILCVWQYQCCCFVLFLLVATFPVGQVLVRKMPTVTAIYKTSTVTFFSFYLQQSGVENIPMTVVVSERGVLSCFNLPFGRDACSHTHTHNSTYIYSKIIISSSNECTALSGEQRSCYGVAVCFFKLLFLNINFCFSPI